MHPNCETIMRGGLSLSKRSRGKRFIKQSEDAVAPKNERWEDVHTYAENEKNRKGKRS